jgi:hypothetical protein
MVEIISLIVSVRGSLQEIAKQALALGSGLQNAAPGDKSGIPSKSVLYLLDTAEQLSAIVKECEALIYGNQPNAPSLR